MTSRVIVKYIASNGFIKANERAFTLTNGNFNQQQYYSLTFPLEPSGDTYFTGLTKEEASKLEEDLYLEKGTLNPRSNWVRDYSVKFDKYAGTVLNPELPEHALALACLKANSASKRKLVAMTDKDKTGDTVLVAMDEFVETKDELSKLETEQKAWELVSTLTSVDQRNILLARGEVGVDALAEEKVKSLVLRLVKADPKEFIRLNEVIKDSIKLDIQQMLEFGILKRNGENGRKILISDTDDVLGVGIEEASSWFKNVSNAQEIMRLKNKLQNFKSKK